MTRICQILENAKPSGEDTPEPQVVSFLTSLFTTGSDTRALMIDRVLCPIATIITPKSLQLAARFKCGQKKTYQRERSA